MSDAYFTNVTATIPTWAIKQSIVFVNPANPDDKMEFDSIEALNAEMFRLQAEVERLVKAGDALAETLESAGFDSAMDFWNAAKEGKQP